MVERKPALRLVKISMKIKDIYVFCQDLYENRGAWLKPRVENRGGRYAAGGLGLCLFGRFHQPAEDAPLRLGAVDGGDATGEGPKKVVKKPRANPRCV